MDRKEAKKICDMLLGRCGRNSTEVTLLVEDSALTRFANNVIHQNVSQVNLQLILRWVEGKRSGIATTNRLDAQALDELVDRARLYARAVPENPDYPGLAEPSPYQAVEAYDETTVSYSPQQRAEQVGAVCRMATEASLNASGAFQTGYDAIAIANSNGLFAYHAVTRADFQTVVMSDDSSGRAQGSSWVVAEIPVEDLGRQAIHKAETGRGPRPVEPGEYAVVLDPYATDDILGMLNYYGMGAQAVLEGRSWMNDRIGQQAMSQMVNIWDDGLDLCGRPIPFDFEGVPKARVDIVSNGVIGSPVYDRETALKAGQHSTGHALPPTLRGYGPMATHLFMAPGDASLEQMIHSTDRGLYITRFWYTRLVHPRDCVITGMTRDGVFMIEGGELAYPVKNLRFTQSYVQALADLQAIGSQSYSLFDEYGFAVRVPAIKIGAFNFTGVTV